MYGLGHSVRHPTSAYRKVQYHVGTIIGIFDSQSWGSNRRIDVILISLLIAASDVVVSEIEIWLTAVKIKLFFLVQWIYYIKISYN